MSNAIVEKSIRQSFDHINNHRWDAAVKALARHIHHRVSGTHDDVAVIGRGPIGPTAYFREAVHPSSENVLDA